MFIIRVFIICLLFISVSTAANCVRTSNASGSKKKISQVRFAYGEYNVTFVDNGGNTDKVNITIPDVNETSAVMGALILVGKKFGGDGSSHINIKVCDDSSVTLFKYDHHDSLYGGDLININYVSMVEVYKSSVIFFKTCSQSMETGQCPNDRNLSGYKFRFIDAVGYSSFTPAQAIVALIYQKKIKLEGASNDRNGYRIFKMFTINR